VIFQRSRFCAGAGFREPFMTGNRRAHAGRGPGARRVDPGLRDPEIHDLKDKASWVFPAAAGLASPPRLAFGVGMTLAGGCGAAGSGRAGEGQVKLWVALACFALSASLVRGSSRRRPGFCRSLGAAVFLPSTLGWAGAIVLIVAIALGWAMLATWNGRQPIQRG